MAIEIVDLSMKSGDFPVRYVNVYQRVQYTSHMKSPLILCTPYWGRLASFENTASIEICTRQTLSHDNIVRFHAVFSERHRVSMTSLSILVREAVRSIVEDNYLEHHFFSKYLNLHLEH